MGTVHWTGTVEETHSHGKVLTLAWSLGKEEKLWVFPFSVGLSSHYVYGICWSNWVQSILLTNSWSSLCLGRYIYLSKIPHMCHWYPTACSRSLSCTFAAFFGKNLDSRWVRAHSYRGRTDLSERRKLLNSWWLCRFSQGRIINGYQEWYTWGAGSPKLGRSTSIDLSVASVGIPPT